MSISSDEFLYISEEGLKRLNEIRLTSDPVKDLEWTTDYTVELPIKLKKNGPGSEKPVTLIEMFEKALNLAPKSIALKVKRENKWISWTFEQYYEDACNFARGLISIGMTPYSSVNIIGFNAPEWHITFYGSIFGNYLPVGIYTTNNPEGCKYVSLHSEAELVVAENQTQLTKYLSIWKELPKLRLILLYNDVIPQDLPAEYKGKVLLYRDFLEKGRNFVAQVPSDMLEKRMIAQKPGNCCTLVYTSGTTGPPKGVMISHDNYIWTAQTTLSKYGFNYGNETIVSYLPLSHVASQIIDIVGNVFAAVTVVFAEPTALQGTLIDTLKEVRPSLFFSVPRIWEKIEEKMKNIAAQNGKIKTTIATWAKTLGKEGTYAELNNLPPPFGFSIAKFLVYNNIKKALGLDNARHMIFGAAPMALSTREYFLSLNFFLKNGYGMSECAGPQTITDPTNFKTYDNHSMISTGTAIPGTEMIIMNPDNEGNGEICFRGRNRFMGYYKNEGETRSTIDNQGYLHSGDVGKIDERGNLTITGRIKELIITAGGENVAPVLIENQITEAFPFLSNVMVIGEKRKFLSALFTLRFELDKELKPTDKLAEIGLRFFKSIGSNSEDYKDVIKDAVILKYIEEGMKRINSKAISRAQEIRKWKIIPGDFSVDGGELTPTLKLKRRFTSEKYNKIIEEFYNEAKL